MNATDAVVRLARAGLSEILIGGNCPVECEAEVDGMYLYFKARGDGWRCSIDVHHFFAIAGHDCAYTACGTYGEGFDAGYMPLEEAVALIEGAVEAWRMAKEAGR